MTRPDEHIPANDVLSAKAAEELHRRAVAILRSGESFATAMQATGLSLEAVMAAWNASRSNPSHA